MKSLMEKKLPFGKFLKKIKAGIFLRKNKFQGSDNYWIRRYQKGRTSGSGSYGKLAIFKADTLNSFVKEKKINTIIEYGCGDGNQLNYAQYPDYIGFDVSPKAIELCNELNKNDLTREFRLLDQYQGERADLTLSLDVIYHLVEDDVFSCYMERLFDSADRFVIIYSSNFENNAEDQAQHVRHRKFTSWVEDHQKDWQLAKFIPNRFPYSAANLKGSLADFCFFEKKSDGSSNLAA